MKHLDQQIARYESELRRDLFLSSEECGRVATLVAADVRFLPGAVKDEIRAASPVPLKARYDELIAFQAWSDFAASIKSRPEVTRAQVIVQNYVCFAYLKDACFEVVASKAKPGSVAERCAKFLTTGAVRDFPKRLLPCQLVLQIRLFGAKLLGSRRRTETWRRFA